MNRIVVSAGYRPWVAPLYGCDERGWEKSTPELQEIYLMTERWR